MIDADKIRKIIAVYHKHGWILQRVLLSPSLRDRIGNDLSHLIDGVQVMDSDVDAAWFSRPPKPGGVPWELRHLSETPYARLENIDDADAGFEDALRSVESQLRESILKLESA